MVLYFFHFVFFLCLVGFCTAEFNCTWLPSMRAVTFILNLDASPVSLLDMIEENWLKNFLLSKNSWKLLVVHSSSSRTKLERGLENCNHFHNILRLFQVLPIFFHRKWNDPTIFYKHDIYKLPHELPKELRLRDLRKLGKIIKVAKLYGKIA